MAMVAFVDKEGLWASPVDRAGITFIDDAGITFIDDLKQNPIKITIILSLTWY